MIKNVIFDVGRVLVGWDPTSTMKELGFDDTVIRRLHECLFDTKAWSEEDRGVMEREELLDYLVSQDPSLKEEILLFYEHAIDSITPKDYAIPWIKALKAAGIGTYVLSNFGDEKMHQGIEKGSINFLDILDGYIFSYEVKQIKPNPEIYIGLLDKYNLKAEECVFIDDIYENVLGAKAVGINSFQFIDYNQALDELKKLGVEF